MRIYIIANDGITLCPEMPAAMTEGEIAVASKEELYAAPLSGKRLLALWNALPSVEKRRKVGDRAALIDQLWTAIEALPEPEPQSDAKRPSKATVSPSFFFSVPEKRPRTVCRCQPIAVATSSTVAPSGRRSIAMTSPSPHPEPQDPATRPSRTPWPSPPLRNPR
jgi:hypothetical protein